MSPHAYTEDQLVEQPAMRLLGDLGWKLAQPHPHPDPLPEGEGVWVDETGLFGRETKGEVVLLGRLRSALERLNPALPPEALANAVDEITRDRSAMGLPAANREIYRLLKEGIRVSLPDPETPPSPRPSPSGRGWPGGSGEGSRRAGGGQRTERVRVVDWDNPAANDFLAVRQISFTGPLYTCRPDIVGYVNGLPLVVLEFKKPGVPARTAFDENITSYKHAQNGIPALFAYNALIIASNGTDSRVGSLTADWDRFFEWKRIEREDEPRRVSLEVMIRGTCDRVRLLDIVENFTLFSEHKAGLVKIIGQNHQVLGVNNAITSTLAARASGHGRGGVFWQTQGSGKSFSMVFFAQKILRKVAGNWTFVVVTDRVELDDQIAKTFKATSAVSETEGDECHAESGAHLRELLRGNHRYVFTLIHKFQPERPEAETPSPGLIGHPLPLGEGRGEGQPSRMPMLSDRRDIVVMVDEAHRSQYDTLALNMRAALPRALFLAFTGTPLIAGEERTRDVFGDYVSIYDFQQSVEDGATVPLFYENRTPELQLINPDLNDDIYNLIEAAELDPEQEAKLERELSKQYHILTRDDRLDTIAGDIVRHFLGRGFLGKAMVVSIDKATALKMHDKVRKHWAEAKAAAEKELAALTSYKVGRTVPVSRSSAETPRPTPNLERIQDLQRQLEILRTTDMALIVSAGQNEIEQMKAHGLDIAPHRKRMNDGDLDEAFKDPENPLRLVFLCAMWLTGFDAPSCSTLYLDKPMRNHTLMQTIARANRVFPGKHSGLIVDYANVFASLEKALAIYGAGKGGASPVKDKQKLVDDLRKAVAGATEFGKAHGVSLAAIESLPVGTLKRLEFLEKAVNALISPDPLRREFLGHERLVGTLYGAVKPDPAALEYEGRVAGICAIADAIRAKLNPNPVDIGWVMNQVRELLDNSITGVDMPDKPAPVMNLSTIDFEALARRFKMSKTRNTDLEVLKAAIRAQMEKLIRLNRTRANFQQTFEELIESYNNGSRNIEELFEQLLALSRGLTEEQQRHMRENMTEEELVIFDILTRPAPELSTEERAEVKKVARALLDRLKKLLVLNWRQKSTALSQLKLTIEDVLDEGLPRTYTPDLYQQKCSALFEHVFESYPERDAGVYASAF